MSTLQNYKRKILNKTIKNSSRILSNNRIQHFHLYNEKITINCEATYNCAFPYTNTIKIDVHQGFFKHTFALANAQDNT